MSKSKQQSKIPMTTFKPYQEPYTVKYSTSSFAPQPYVPEYPTEPAAPEIYVTSETVDADYSCDCPSPPPYSCHEVQCDQVGQICTVTQPPVVVAGIFSSKPASTICPCCRQIITTETVYRVGSLTYAASMAMCMIGCCCGCCVVPFVTSWFKDVDHYCPYCQYHIYRYKKL